MYYEIHGTGQPLVLLHGAFRPSAPRSAHSCRDWPQSRQVIAFELQAHGHTADIDRPLSSNSWPMMSLAIRHLGPERADIFGYSMGGVALHVVIRRPDVVRSSSSLRSPRSERVHPGPWKAWGR
jgi:pimeloyl-ACP methyl ester carboxylesterase